MTPRSLLTTIGATALTFGTIIGGTATAPHVYAQTATETPAAATSGSSSATSSSSTDANAAPTDPREAFKRERIAAYQSFVASMAKELNLSTDAVDKAIRASLKQEVADQLAAGKLTKEQAAARSAVIDVADAPLFLGMGGPEMGGPMGGPGMHGSMAGPGMGGQGRGEGWGNRGKGGEGPGNWGGMHGQPGANGPADDQGNPPAVGGETNGADGSNGTGSTSPATGTPTS